MTAADDTTKLRIKEKMDLMLNRTKKTTSDETTRAVNDIFASFLGSNRLAGPADTREADADAELEARATAIIDAAVTPKGIIRPVAIVGPEKIVAPAQKLSVRLTQDSAELITSGKVLTPVLKTSSVLVKQCLEFSRALSPSSDEDPGLKDKKRSKKEKKEKKSRRSPDRGEKRSRSRSKDRPKRSRSKDRPKRSRSRERERSRDKPRRSRSRERSRRRSHSRDSKSKSRAHFRSRSRSPRRYSPPRHPGPRAASPQRYGVSSGRSGEDYGRGRLRPEDKARLRQIALKNVKRMAGEGSITSEALRAVKQRESNVGDLTRFCKQLAEMEDDSDSSPINKPIGSDDEEEEFARPNAAPTSGAAIRFVINDKSGSVLPNATGDLRMSFPVSSGTQHRKSEANKPPVPPSELGWEDCKPSESSAKQNDVFATVAPPKNINIGELVSQRLDAIRMLQENPNNKDAAALISQLDDTMAAWAQSHNVPGQWTGGTDVQTLKPEQLNGGNLPWVQKDVFKKAKPIYGGIGRFLLYKMGWKEGTGLGRFSEGDVNPLLLDFKVDRKGLHTLGEEHRNTSKVPRKSAIPTDLSGKHPVSALSELTIKRGMGSINYRLVFDEGPPHRKQFLYKVTVNGVDYQSNVCSPQKKEAKSVAAIVALQALGLWPKNSGADSGSTVSVPAIGGRTSSHPVIQKAIAGQLGAPIPRTGLS